MRRIYLLIVLLTLCIAGMQAQEIEVPAASSSCADSNGGSESR